MPSVLKFLGSIGETTFEEEVKAGRYPKPFKLSKRINGWRIADIIKGVEQPKT
jgi:predicted DNA-binding transcriptional regulator AlpA